VGRPGDPWWGRDPWWGIVAPWWGIVLPWWGIVSRTLQFRLSSVMMIAAIAWHRFFYTRS